MKYRHFKPKKEKRGLMFKIFILVAVIQILLVGGFSGYIVTQQFINKNDGFEAPLQTEKIPIPERERKVQVKRDQQKSRKMTKRITVPVPKEVVTQDLNIIIPDFNIDGIGISAITTEELRSNMKINIPTINIFDVKSVAEKVLICIDTGPYLMTDERGGLDTYKVIREDIKKVIDGLPPTVLFNLMAYDLRYGVSINMFQSNLVPATKFNKRIASNWINPLNSSLDRIGAGGNNYKYKFPFLLPQPPNSAYYSPHISNIYKVYQAAIEQGADTIYFLTTGWIDPEWIKMPWTDADFVRFRREEENFERRKERTLRSAGWTEDKLLDYYREEEIAKANGAVKGREWLKAENEKRKASGISLFVGNPADAMWRNNLVNLPENRPPDTGRPPEPRFKSYGRRGLFTAFEPIFKQVYRDKNARLPTVNMILFKGKNEDSSPDEQRVIRAFTKANGDGRSRTLKGLRPVSEQGQPEESEKTAAN